jgi:formylglycine-generating enzyme required for sulfatase activity/phosphatidylethanolamine-binding protein (PEBP) family uncharacterized protein
MRVTPMLTRSIIILALVTAAVPLMAQDSPEGPRQAGRLGGGLRLIPRSAADQMDLTAQQQRQIDALENETRARLDKILSPDQQQTLQELRSQRRGEQGEQGSPGGVGRQQRGGGDGPPRRQAVEPVALPNGLPPAVAGKAVLGALPGFVTISAGNLQRGDHHGFDDPQHGSDEIPVRLIHVDAFSIGINNVTTKEYCEFLNSALDQRSIEVRAGGVYLVGGKDLLCDTRQSSPVSRIAWDGKTFSVLDHKEDHPMVCVRWHGACAYCNWISAKHDFPQCYNTTTWDCDFNKSGFRLPTEAEWEYAARGGHYAPYWNFPFGNVADATKANWPESRNPYRTGPFPWTTPVGFFDGNLHRKRDYGWPGEEANFQTANGANPFGLNDMAGNVWQWCTEWYDRDYYAYCPESNPPDPAAGSPMPDGKPYRCMRGGSWFNGEWGHSRVSNRDPSYFRGPDPITHRTDPDGPYFHIGFRLVLPIDAEKRPIIKPTPVPRVRRALAQDNDRPRNPGPRRQDNGNAARNNPPVDGDRPPRDDQGERREQAARDTTPSWAVKPMASFVLRSPEIKEDGKLPKEFTGDGAGISPPLEWSGAPAGTKCYALIVHHIAPDMTKWYWVLYNIPANVTKLPTNSQDIGTAGNNSVNRNPGYAPPKSKGPGAKTYTYTLYALSAAPKIIAAPEDVNREVLLRAMKDSILATAMMNVTYAREGLTGNDERPPQDGDDRPPPPDNGDRPPRRPPDNENNPPPRESQAGPPSTEPSRQEVPVPGGHTVGLFKNGPLASPGYTLFAPKHHTMIYLLDNEGRAVHSWKSQYEPGQSVYLLENGHLLHCCFTKNRGFTSGGEGGRLEEFDWDGKLVWEFDYPSDTHLSHHDIKPLPNGNVLVLAVEKKSYEDCLAAGFNPRMMRDQQLFPEFFIEVQPTRPKGGKIVWEWHVWDHLIQRNDRAKANYGDVARHPELVDVNCNGRATPAFWNHGNSIAYNARLDQIMLSARGCNEIWVVDHATTTEEAAGHKGGKRGRGGDLLYRWGNPAAFGQGTRSDRQLFQQHDAQWIPDGYPGAGHILIFNNGLDRGYSTIEEIVPPVDEQGNYLLASNGAYGPDRPVWQYKATNPGDFYSAEISGAHRLANGNTLICAGVKGTFFEVTPQGETVWQYVSPVVHNGILAQGELSGKDHRGHNWNAVFKIHRYEPDYPGLAGKDLKPLGDIEQPAELCGKTGFHDQAPEGHPVGREGKGNQGSGGRRPRPGNDPGGDGDRPPRADDGPAPPRNVNGSDLGAS